MTSPALEAKLSDIHSWWEVPCIAHFCSLFRASFNLIDFDIEDLEEALLTDDASDSGNTLIQELIVRLLRGYYGNNSISTFNYQMFLRRLFRQKCRELDCYNPFDNDMDFQFLPMRTKVEILHMLCDFRLDADDVLDILKDLDSDSLRVHPLGYDSNKSAYWYFYGTRLYREDYPKNKKEEKKRGRKRKRGRNKEEDSEEEELELGSGIWQVVCFTESDWERLALSTEDALDKNEQALHQIIAEDFLPEIPKLFQEKERLQRKRFRELHPRKSSRIENLKRRKEEEMQYIEKYKRAFGLEGSDSEDEAEINARRARDARHERWKNRNNQKEDFLFSEDDKSDSDSFHDSVTSCNTQLGGVIVGRGRQTNNSLSSAVDEIIISSAERSRSPEWFDTKLEDLHIGMYKVLNKLKDHKDAWPFLEPVNEDDAPNYYKVVKCPMNLQWMEEKLDCGKYKSLTEFRKDFQLILGNCKQYNGSRNEYTIMGENLDKVFESSVNRYICSNNSSDGEDVTGSSDFQEIISSHKRKKKKRRRRTCSKSTEDADKENERKLSAIEAPYSVLSAESDTRNADDSLSIESRIGERKPKRGKGRPPKNASAFDALDIITEQTLRDINKWLDDTPKYTDFCSVTDSPPPSNLSKNEVICEISSTTVSEANIQKTAVKPFKNKDATKRKSTKENHHKHLQLIKQRRRDIQRTIDRLQPGKSKGNLISTIGKTPNNKFNSNKEPLTNTKLKEVATKTENTHRPKPMLSLGSVLSSDIINLDVNAKKHTFSDYDSIPSEEEDPYSENDDNNIDSNELQAENLALDKTYIETVYSEEKKCLEDKSVSDNTVHKTDNNLNSTITDNIKTNLVNNADKSEKPTPNLSAWFKAFGAPKTQQPLKRKTDAMSLNENPSTPLSNEELKDDDTSITSNYKLQSSKSALEEDRYDINEPPPPTPGRFFLYEEDKNQKFSSLSLPSPDPQPLKRQRRLSTGSSVSERSSFSQDPNDPLSSPHPSLDDMSYQSPQHCHQSPIHNTGALKVGFYQDMFPKCSSDKSNSCSPREPMSSFSPQNPGFSPRDSVTSPRGSIASPREYVTSPKGEPVASPRDFVANYQLTSPRNAISSPMYNAASPREQFSESVRSPNNFSKSSPVYCHSTNGEIPNQNLSSQSSLPYKSPKKIIQDDMYRFTPSTISVEKSPFSVYPVKKRISAELEQKHHVEQDNINKCSRTESPFAPIATNQESEKRFTPTPGCLPQHILGPNPFTPSATPSIPISLSHHHPHVHHHPSFMDSYSENILLTPNPYFRKDLYVPSQEISHPTSSPVQPTSHISPLFMQQSDPMYSTNEKLPSTQPHYTPSRQVSSPLVTSSYARSNVPLDFTSSVASSMPLSNKPAESFPSQYPHSKYHHVAEPEVALNFSNKNAPQHPYLMNYGNESDRKIDNNYQRNKIDLTYSAIEDINKYDKSITGLSSSENLYHSSNDIKHQQSHSNYRANASPYPNATPDYYNSKSASSNYSLTDLRYSNFPNNTPDRPVHENKQYYASSTQSKNHLEPNYIGDRSITELIPSGLSSRSSLNFNQTLPGVTNTPKQINHNAPVSVNRYENNFNSGNTISHINELPPAAIKSNTSKKSKKKKIVPVISESSETAVAAAAAAQNTSIYPHYLGASGNQPNVPISQNGIVTGSAFNFGASTLKSDYHQYLENLRNPRYFAESGSTDKSPHPPPPVSNSSFQFLTQRSSPSFSLSAQAFMNANPAPPCPSIYSSPYLQRSPDDLLRPMILQQGLMSAHSGGYPHGYLNMHDPINRSPWL